MKRWATLLGIGLTALVMSQSEVPIQNDCGNNIWNGQFLNGESGLYEYRKLDMSEGYTEAMLYGNDYYLIIYVKDIYGNLVGISLPVNQTFVFGVVEGELRRGN